MLGVNAADESKEGAVVQWMACSSSMVERRHMPGETDATTKLKMVLLRVEAKVCPSERGQVLMRVRTQGGASTVKQYEELCRKRTSEMEGV